MSHFIALSFADHFADEAKLDLERRTTAALGSLLADTEVATDQFGDVVVTYHLKQRDTFIRRPGGCSMMHLGHSVVELHQRRTLSNTELGSLWFSGKDRALDSLGSPFALIGRRDRQGPFCALADRYGLVHLYGWQGAGVCAIASSAHLIGTVFGLEIDLDAVGRFALLGHYFDSETPIRGVRKCSPGDMFEARSGSLSARKVFPKSPPATDDVVDYTEAGVEALLEAVRVYRDAYPGCDVELSGGIDSRLLLSAIPKSQRCNHRAVTLGGPESVDVKVAREIANENGMDHLVIDTDASSKYEPQPLLGYLRNASMRHDHAVNPIDKLSLECVRAELGSKPRLSGQNGEAARGFYYVGQPLHGGQKSGRVERLVKWRLMGNDSVRADVFNGEYRRELISGLNAGVNRVLESYKGEWPVVLDQLYLGQRMQRWCGASVSGSYSHRPVLMPFFHPAFVQWAHNAPPAAKHRSNLACSLIERVAPELATIPFDSGWTPEQLASSGIRHATRHAVITGHKLTKRLRNRISKARRHNLGTRSVMEVMAGCDLSRVLNYDRLCSTNIFDQSMLESLVSGRVATDRATLGFLFALDFTLDSLVLGDISSNTVVCEV